MAFATDPRMRAGVGISTTGDLQITARLRRRVSRAAACGDHAALATVDRAGFLDYGVMT